MPWSSASPTMSSSTSEARSAPALTRGRLQTTFARDPEGKSYLARQYASYPFHLCRAQYLDLDLPEMASLYVQTSAGGIYAGDRLHVEIRTEAGARAHVTTQASSIAYRMPGGEARQRVHLSGGPGSLLEYLPDPTILFPEARLRTAITLAPAPGALIVAGDSFLPHDPGGGGRPFGFCAGETRVVGPEGRLLALDRFHFDGPAWTAGSTGVSRTHRMQGTLVAAGDAAAPGALLDALREALAGTPASVYGAASTLPNGCGAWARLLAADGAELNDSMLQLWSALRTKVTGRPPARRRK